jgi:hypothetical protein
MHVVVDLAIDIEVDLEHAESDEHVGAVAQSRDEAQARVMMLSAVPKVTMSGE